MFFTLLYINYSTIKKKKYYINIIIRDKKKRRGFFEKKKKDIHKVYVKEESVIFPFFALFSCATMI
jgi:hypothetical protein